MFSTFRILRTRKQFSIDSFTKSGNVRSYHLCAIQKPVPARHRLLLWKSKGPLAVTFINSQKFASTDAPSDISGSTNFTNESLTTSGIVEPLPEPPTPLVDAGDLTDLRKESIVYHEDFHQEDNVNHKDLHEETIVHHEDLHEESVFNHQDLHEETIINHEDLHAESTINHEDLQEEAIVNHEDLHEEAIVNHEVLPNENLSFEVLYEAVIPEVLPDPPVNVTEVLGGGEPTFESLGLGGWTPVGILENCFEYLHVTCDLPWWGTIVAGTIVVRILMFPLVIISQRNAAKMNNHLPEIQKIQLKMTEARQRGDRIDTAKRAQQLMTFMSEKGLNPLKNMVVPLAQAPFFISFFMSLRAMSSLPVESLKIGGLFWFTDLTMPDEFYLLPIITCATLALTIEIGTDAIRLKSANMGAMKYVLKAMPFIVFPFTIGFPAAVLVYWTSSNFISLVQVSVLKIPRVRSYFKIEPLVKHDTEKLPIKEKGFVGGLKESWTNIKITRELEDRERADEMNFMKAGRGPVRKTFKFDPTRTLPPRSIGAIQAKKRD